MTGMLRFAVGVWAAVVLSAPAAALDGVALEAGRGNGTDMGRVALQWNWNARWLQGSSWHLGGYWDLGLGYWRRDAVAGQNGDITEIGLTPVFRIQRNDLSGLYGELAVGAHFLSRTALGDKRFGTSFQFGDHVGIGYRLGAKGAVDLGYRYQHMSNGGIKAPNNGVTLHQIRLGYHF